MIRLFIIIGIIALIIIAYHSGKTLNLKETEEEYQNGIKYINDGKWGDATLALVNLQEENYKDSEVLYNYASAQETLAKDGPIVGTEMADYYMKSVPANYSGVLKEDILKFKQECIEKFKASEEQAEAQKKAIEEANKITPGSRKVRIGMTQDEAIISMGKPYDINRTVSSYGTHEQWCYNGGVYLYFEDGILSSWQD